MQESEKRETFETERREADAPFLTTGAAALFLGGLSRRTLERWRVVGEGPPFLKLGRRVFYARRDLVEYATQQRRRSTSETRSLASSAR